MAQRVQVILVCDLHDDETPGTETVSFGLNGSSYEIDLCDIHAEEMRDSLDRYVAVGRRATGRSSRAGTRRRGRNGAGGEAAQIREWARGQGLPVPERGRIPAELADKYAAAH